MDKVAWYRLDNVGKFYSAQAGDPKQTVFRISAVMRREVRPDVLQQALEATVGQLPSFNVVLRSGLFWRYLQQAPEVPQVQPENQPVCFGLHAGRKSVLYRVSYFRDRINLEMSHMIADGRGALAFLKTLLEFYAELLRHEAPSPEALAMLEEQGGGNTTQEAEDSFSRYFDKSKAGATPSTRPYRLAGWRNEANPTFMEVHLPVAGVVAAAKRMGVSVTSFLVAALVQALRAGMSTGAENRPITMDVPVDLRSVYGSETLRNFFGLAFISCSPQLATGPLDAIARDVQRQLTDATIPANLARRMNQMVKLEKNPVVRWVPSFVKDAALALGDWKARREVTCTFSNLGRVVLPPAAAAEVRSIGCLTSTRGLNFLAVSCEDDLTLASRRCICCTRCRADWCAFWRRRGWRRACAWRRTPPKWMPIWPKLVWSCAFAIKPGKRPWPSRSSIAPPPAPLLLRLLPPPPPLSRLPPPPPPWPPSRPLPAGSPPRPKPMMPPASPPAPLSPPPLAWPLPPPSPLPRFPPPPPPPWRD